jgi:hypothetical protein
VNLPAVLFVFFVGFFLLKLPRSSAPLPLIIGASYMTLGPSLDVGPFHFTVIRILIAIGFLRVLVRGERIMGKLTSVDRLMLLWSVATVLTSFFHTHIAETLVFHLGLAYNGLGLYFLFRIFIQNIEDIPRLSKIIIIALVPIALEMILESVTRGNSFAFLGGVPELCEVRNGKIRAQGPFAHSILAGTVGAVCLPLAIALWHRSRKIALVGMAATGLIIVCSKSSGPLLSAIFAVGGMILWKFRTKMRLIRRGAFVALLVIAAVMNAPFYYIVARIDLAGGSTGWHRAHLIESAINHIDDWWLAGTDYTADWTPNAGSNDNETDITNHYVRMAVWGGLPMMLLFIGTLQSAFGLLSKALKPTQDFMMQEQFIIWALGCSLFAHVATMMSVSYFDQSVLFLYLVLAAIASAYTAVRHQQPNSNHETLKL